MRGLHGTERRTPPTRRRRIVMLATACLMLLASGLLATVPFILQLSDMHAQSASSTTHDDAAARQDRRRTARELADAHDWNRRLADDGPDVIGEASDPFDPEAKTSKTDSSYRRQLDSPKDGIMATVEYPRLGIRLPIRHGTDADTLLAGAGHLYGSSLPVGGASTHTVIAAHRGMPDRLMFTRLGEARRGDVFYLHVLGRTLAYRVTDIRVTEPDDTTPLRIRPGRDLATLYTCTPYGRNTHRLLVTGTRARIPGQAPDPSDAPHDRLPVLMVALIVLVWAALVAAVAWKGIPHHASHR